METEINSLGKKEAVPKLRRKTPVSAVSQLRACCLVPKAHQAHLNSSSRRKDSLTFRFRRQPAAPATIYSYFMVIAWMPILCSLHVPYQQQDLQLCAH